MATDLAPRPVSSSQATMSELMMPQHANNMGNVFGGVILSLIDRVAAVAATRHARRQCVTVSVDRVDFLQPIYMSELVTARASVNFAGHTSMEVGISIEAENLLTGERRHTNSCYVTYVAIGDDGKPAPVPQVIPETEDQKRRYRAAEERRARRLKERKAR